MKRFILLITYLFPLAVSAQSYSTLLIPDSLLNDANAVLRFDETKIIIHSINSATIKHKFAYTIMNEKGNQFAEYYELYDDFNKLTDVTGNLYDATGNKINGLKKKDLLESSYDDNFSLITDARIKHHNFYNRTFPYTIEYEENWEYKGIYEFPNWQPILTTNCSVQKSFFSIEMPTNYQLRYKLINAAKEPTVLTTDKTKTLLWETENIKAITFEYFQPEITSLIPSVLIGPTDFEYAGYKGNLSTWNNYGKFYAILYKDRDHLPENVKKEIHKLSDSLSTIEEKIKVLYSYLQQNTRYISIQLGIGGLQPFDANFVAEKKYGDCKALSNFMVSILKEAGIKANNVIIYGGNSPVKLFEDFPKHYFNHVVTCVPNGTDTVWLECTSQTVSAGYAGTFTGNRKALLITEDGGQLVNTPKYSATDNLQKRKIEASISENGDLLAESFTRFSGIQQELQHFLLHNANPEQKEKYLNRSLNLPTYQVEKIVYKEIKGEIPVIEEYLKISSANYASVTTKRLFIQPNLFNKGIKLPTYENRKYAVELKESFRDVDSVFIKIPDGYILESLPKDIFLETNFGSYSISFHVQGNQIELIRFTEQHEGIYPPMEYKNLVSFFDLIYKTDREKIVFVKKD